jgi:hypothetical protein
MAKKQIKLGDFKSFQVIGLTEAGKTDTNRNRFSRLVSG